MESKCPRCGKTPTKMVFGAGWAQDGHRCCGHTTDTALQWNQYAAAMELARATFDYQDYDCIDALKPAKQRVIEVIRGK